MLAMCSLISTRKMPPNLGDVAAFAHEAISSMTAARATRAAAHIRRIVLLAPAGNGNAIRLIISSLEIAHDRCRNAIGHVQRHYWSRKTQFIAERYKCRPLLLECLHRIRLRVVTGTRGESDLSAAVPGHLRKFAPATRKSFCRRTELLKMTCACRVLRVTFDHIVGLQCDRADKRV